MGVQCITSHISNLLSSPAYTSQERSRENATIGVPCAGRRTVKAADVAPPEISLGMFPECRSVCLEEHTARRRERDGGDIDMSSALPYRFVETLHNAQCIIDKLFDVRLMVKLFLCDSCEKKLFHLHS